ncbi:hypothetical protein PTSG_06480 [Salpingoeca rosetta]|uniref:Cadherin domain-containing protein n=1 Tax=Salpingoeca rosetta (strain ATCC 50818 / BSB-021) TaxID=946362 RepID=F2UFX7_SALR5|nr:uncharacterized protein PTSG_06480 [Salpingoeca rosetta]EGD75405.1 hypothetical protein PTSG_06480 [Salpingoeca rosetta]|eukprot:XP_004991862.1 hypothetical protein PTSG_06480 [Salpingoeca rosetta]
MLLVKSAVPLNHEANPVVTTSISSIDNNGAVVTSTFNISVADINEPPTDVVVHAINDTSQQLLQQFLVPEQPAHATTAAQPWLVGAVRVLDPDTADATADPHPFVFDVSPAGIAYIENQQLFVDRSALDFESQSSFVIINVTARDARDSSLAVSHQFTLLVQDLNESPSSVVPNGVSFHLRACAPGHRGRLAHPGATLNYEVRSVFVVTVTATDQGGLSATSQILVSVQDRNDAPTTPTITSNRLPENTTALPFVVGTLQATDEDASQMLQFAIDSIDPPHVAPVFALDGAALVYDNTDSPDVVVSHETTPTIAFTITVQDSGGPGDNDPPLSTTTDIVVRVVDSNDAPQGLVLINATAAVPENAVAGTFVGTLAVTGEDMGETITFEILLGGEFLAVATPQPTACSGGAGLCTADVPPYLLELSTSSVAENTPPGIPIATIVAFDEDRSGDEHTCQLLFGGDSALLSLLPPNTLTVAAGMTVNFEERASLTFAVWCSDVNDGTVFATANLTLDVVDVQEPPTAVVFAASEPVPEVRSQAIVLGTLSTIDEDAQDSTIFVLSDNDGGRLTIAQTNEVVILADAPLDFETQPARTFNVTAVDLSGIPVSRQFTYEVADVNEPPTAPTITPTLGNGGDNSSDVTIIPVPETTAVGTVIATLASTDPEGTPVSFVVGGQDSAFVAVDGASIVLATPVNFEGGSSSSSDARLFFWARASDGVNDSPTTHAGIAIGDVNEAPSSIVVSPTRVPENALPGAVTLSVTITDPDEDDSVVITGIATDPANINITIQTQPSCVSVSPQEGNNGTLAAGYTECSGAVLSLNQPFNYEQLPSFVLTLHAAVPAL